MIIKDKFKNLKRKVVKLIENTDNINTKFIVVDPSTDFIAICDDLEEAREQVKDHISHGFSKEEIEVYKTNQKYRISSKILFVKD